MSVAYADTDEEAARRHAKWQDVDPYPDVPYGLLNSAEIEAYIASTGMVFPFEGPSRLKPASLEIPFRGEVRYWRLGEKKPTQQTIKKGMKFTIPKNSIVFIQPETCLRIPSYIALRFNLVIGLVHKGLLLGTGPIVDPQFEKWLCIPIHNLTNSDCELEAGDGLIWMEVTKLHWRDEAQAQNEARADLPAVDYSRLVAFPDRKKQLQIDDYLRRASGFEPIVSSIPEIAAKALDQARVAEQLARESGKSAQESAKQAKGARTATTVGTILVVLTVVGLVIASFNVSQSAVSLVSNSESRIMTELKATQEAAKLLEARIDAIEVARVPHAENDGRPVEQAGHDVPQKSPAVEPPK